jgi:DNA-binding response OmpR family regulator
MSQTKTKVLIADDEESLRTLLSAVVSSNENFELVTAIDGDDALIKIKKDKPDILILDVMMPGQSGFEVCESIKANDELKDIKVIILTAKGQESDREWADSVGADYFLSKPFSPLELLELLKVITSKAK